MERHRIYMEHVTASVTVRDYIIGLEKTRTADHVDEETRTADHVDAETRTADHVDAETRTADHVDALRPLARQIGTTVGLMHSHDVIHGDLTTSNMLLRTLSKGTPEAGGDSVAGFDGSGDSVTGFDGSGDSVAGFDGSGDSVAGFQLVLIDFGLGYKEGLAEDKGVDLYVLERALLSMHPNTEGLFSVILEHYRTSYVKGAAGVINKLEEIRMRGRKRTMVG